MDCNVEYRGIHRLPGYAFGADGSAWSCWKRVPLGKGKGTGTKSVMDQGSWHMLKVHYNVRDGYPFINPLGKTRALHSLMLEAFKGPRPAGMECCHKDGNKRNVAISNLRWDTRKNNAADRIRHGTQARGVKIGSSKLDDEKVALIRSWTGKQSILVKRFGISSGLVSMIKNGMHWSHVK